MNLFYSDDFNAPVNTEFPLAGTPWVKHQGRGIYKLNDVLSIGAGWNIALTASVPTPSSNQAVEFTVASPLSKDYAVARMTRLAYQAGVATGYMVRVFKEKVTLEKLTANGPVLLAETPTAIPVGQVVRLTSIGDLHQVEYAGSVLLAAIDGDLASGDCGIGAPGQSTLKYTDFRAYAE